MSELEINVSGSGGDVIGANVSGSNIIGKEVVIHNHVIQFLAPEAIARLAEFKKISTEITLDKTAGVEGSKTLGNTESLKKDLDDVLQVVNTLNKQGAQVEGLQTGQMSISRIELLVKKAVLLKTEADQLMFNHLERNKPKIDRYKAQGNATRYEVDMADLFSGFDEAAYFEKLREAYQLLEEANQIDPANTEVLLHMAKLLMQLTPDDSSDESRLLYQISHLLENPKNDTERFQLAQATYLLATRSDTPHLEQLRAARSMFERIGRTEWIKQCDQMIDSIQGTSPDNPVGKWQVVAGDAVGSVMLLDLNPDGTFQCQQHVRAYGMNVQAMGQWVYDPYNRYLQLQGMINGFQPFMLGIILQGQHGNSYIGTGTDGFSYQLSRIG